MDFDKLKSTTQNLSLSSILIVISFACLAVFVSAQSLWAQELDESLFFTGEVKSISITDRKIVIKPAEGKRQHFIFTDETIYKGVFNAKEIKVKQKVTIWYLKENDLLKALKIKVMPELGC